jgi:hypothetical protein
MSKNLNRFHLLLGNLEVWIYPDEKKITFHKINKIPWGSIVVIPEDAVLFKGSYEELEALLELAKVG